MKLWVGRGLRLGCVLIATAIAATCVQSTTVRCEDDSICPDNTQCRQLTDRMLMTCVTDAQLAACITLEEGDRCSVLEMSGTCFAGACYPAACGDRIQDRAEACDDGNQNANDGCSANCSSLERCGDGNIDLPLGEQCEDDTVGISGDGCSSACTTELDFWASVSPAEFGQRLNHTLVTDPLAGVLTFGGMLGSAAGAPPTRETWRWSHEQWQPLTPPTGVPSRRSGSAISYDPLRRRVVLFGGRDLGGSSLGDLWEWDGLAWTQRIAPAGPSPREDAGMACGPSRCVIFGGRAGATVFAETWIWNGTIWAQLGSTPSPAPRTAPALAYDERRQVIVLFGGRSASSTALNDTWELSPGWTQRMPSTPPTPASSARPSATYDSATERVVMVTDGAAFSYDGATWTSFAAANVIGGKITYDRLDRRLLVFGEYGYLKEYDGASWVTKVGYPPSGNRHGVLAAYDPRRGRMLVVDGTRTFEWDGANWQVVTAGTPTSVQAAIAFDRVCSTPVVFGGIGASGLSRETWRYSGGWTSASAPGPEARRLHAMTYDDKRGVVMMFGGLGAGTVELNDVWEWRGDCAAKQWVNVTPQLGPGPRSRAALVYDRAREVSVLFGGTGVGGTVLGDTWEWDGMSWTERAPSPAPDPRSDHSMAYDPRHRSIVMFGGALFGAGSTDETWRWNGTTWSQVAALLSPPPRGGATLTEDVTGTLMFFGGQQTTALAGQIWRLSTATAAGKTETCRDASVDLDDDGLRGCADPDCGPRCWPLCPLGEPCGGPHCGDGTCSPVEDYLICPGDCAPP